MVAVLPRIEVRIRQPANDRSTDTIVDDIPLETDDPIQFREVISMVTTITNRRLDMEIDHYEVTAIWRQKSDPNDPPL
jgi:hypothetical protein